MHPFGVNLNKPILCNSIFPKLLPSSPTPSLHIFRENIQYDRSLGRSPGPRAGFLPQLTRRFFHPGALSSHGQTQLGPHFRSRGPVWSPEAEPPQGTNRRLSCHSPRTNPTGTVTPLTRTHHVGAGTHTAVCTHAHSHTHPTRACLHT